MDPNRGSKSKNAHTMVCDLFNFALKPVNVATDAVARIKVTVHPEM